MTAEELRAEIARLESAESETHARIVALRACLRARVRLDEQIAEADEKARGIAARTN